MKHARSRLLTSSAILGLILVASAATWSTGSPDEGKRSTPPIANAEDRGDDQSTWWLGYRIAGTWLEWFDGGQTLYNFHRDGSHEWFGTWFFGDGTENFLDGPVYGTWKRTGLREITSTELGFLFNGDGSFWATGRVHIVYTFSPDYQSFSYVGHEDLFAPDQDPSDPDAVPFDSFEFGPFGPVNRLGVFNDGHRPERTSARRPSLSSRHGR